MIPSLSITSTKSFSFPKNLQFRNNSHSLLHLLHVQETFDQPGASIIVTVPLIIFRSSCYTYVIFLVVGNICTRIEISALAECKLPSIRGICFCNLVYLYESEVLKNRVILYLHMNHLLSFFQVRILTTPIQEIAQ